MKRGKKSTLVYIVKNFWFMLPIVALPAVLLGFVRASQYDNSPADFFISLFRHSSGGSEFKIENFSFDLFGYFTGFNLGADWWIYLLGLISLFFALCMTVSAVERHMRLGLRSYTKIFTMLNESILAVLPYFVLALFLFEFISLIICGMIYLFYVLNISGWLLFFLSLGVTVAFYALYATFFLLTILTVPSMLSDGYRFNVAVSYSARLVSTRLGIVIARFFGTFGIAWVIQSVSNYLLVNAPWYPSAAHVLVSIIYYLFWCCFLPVFAMKNYVDLTEGVRNDIRVSLF